MTREEAIKILRKEIECLSHTTCSGCPLEKVCDPIMTTPFDSEYIEVYEMAIKALEQEPCEDAISRQIISDYVESHIQEINTGYGDLNKHTNEILRMIVDYIEKMESVTPQTKTGWIPVSERLPEEETDVLICNKQGEIEISQGSRSTEVDAFIWYTSGWRFGEVIAWQPLPEPYKVESEEV